MSLPGDHDHPTLDAATEAEILDVADHLGGDVDQAVRVYHAELTDDEIDLLCEALDSHQYWQLSPEERRSSGYVLEPLTDEERACDTLADKLRKITRKEG